MKYSLTDNCISVGESYDGSVTELCQNLAFNMKRRRTELHLSQLDLAAETNLSAGYIGELESGTKFPSGSTLEKLAKALDIRPYILLMSSDDFIPDARNQAVMEAAGKLKTVMDRGLLDLMERILPRKD